MSGIIQVRLAGFGGQGVVLAGMLLGQAGVMEGKYISGSNSYGAQARGSGCKSEILFSDGPIDFPHLITADIFVAMSQGSYNLYYREMNESTGFILYDQGQVIPKSEIHVRQIGIPATEYALKKIKNKQMTNIVFLGALIESTKIVSPKAIRKAITLHVNKRFQSLNLKALQIGMGLGRQIHG